MKNLFGQFLEFTFWAIIIFLVVTNALGFASIIRELAEAYIGGVSALQGRGRSS